MSSLLAPSALSTSSSSGSVVARPVATFTTIGKKQMMSEVRTAGTVPGPDQATRIGIIATFWIEEKTMSSGYGLVLGKGAVPISPPLIKTTNTATGKRNTRGQS